MNCTVEDDHLRARNLKLTYHRNMMMMMVMVTTTMMTIIQASSLGPVSRVSTRFDVAPRHTCTWSRALGRGHVQTWASASRLAMTSGLAPRPNCPSSSRDCQLLAVVVLTSRLSCLALPRRVHHLALLLLVASCHLSRALVCSPASTISGVGVSTGHR